MPPVMPGFVVEPADRTRREAGIGEQDLHVGGRRFLQHLDRGARPARRRRSAGPCRRRHSASARRQTAARATSRWRSAMPLTSAVTRARKWSCKFLPTPGSACATGTPMRPRWSGSPTPESCRICGEPIAPPDEDHLARSASARSILPPRENSTPTARLPSNRTRCTSASVTTCRFGPLQRRAQIGARRALAAPAAAGLLHPADIVAGSRAAGG